MTNQFLPAHITEEDVRVISEVTTPAVMAEAWRAAARVIHRDSTADSIRAMLLAMAEEAEKR